MGMYSSSSTYRFSSTPRVATREHLDDVLGTRICSLGECHILPKPTDGWSRPLALHHGILGLILTREDAIRWGQPDIHGVVIKQRGHAYVTMPIQCYGIFTSDGFLLNPVFHRCQLKEWENTVPEIWVPA